MVGEKTVWEEETVIFGELTEIGENGEKEEAEIKVSVNEPWKER